MKRELLDEMPEYLQNLYANDEEKKVGIWHLLGRNETEDDDYFQYQPNNCWFADHGVSARRFCWKYSGMGWFWMGVFDTNTKKCFVVLDGGSNDYDRLDNAERLNSYDAKNVPDDRFMTVQELFSLQEDQLEQLCVELPLTRRKNL